MVSGLTTFYVNKRKSKCKYFLKFNMVLGMEAYTRQAATGSKGIFRPYSIEIVWYWEITVKDVYIHTTRTNCSP